LIRTGDPVGYRELTKRLDNAYELLVYPKIFGLTPYGVVSRVLLGSARAARLLTEDLSRPVGVREYRPEDPLRSVDWRATARRRSMMVRVFEPSANLRVALFLDTKVPQIKWPVFDPPELEFTIAVGASILADLCGRGVGIGLYSGGTVDGQPIAQKPATSPDALPHALELLARASPLGPLSFGEVLSQEAGRLPHGTTIVVVAAEFPEATLIALAELRRRQVAVTVVAVITDEDQALPPPDLFDQLLMVRFTDDWSSRASVELAA
jgi:uncharacterized protein (DUF58 family)